jgi:nitroreductase
VKNLFVKETLIKDVDCSGIFLYFCHCLRFKGSMSIIEVIEQRKSIRSYTGEPLSREHIERITRYIAGLQAPFGTNARIELIHSLIGTEPVKLGTYGFIGGASDFLVLVLEEGSLAEEGAAYLFEQVILFCTELGLGTCWLGGAFSRKDFGRQLNLKANEKLRIVSPVGYISSKKRFSEIFTNAKKHHVSRKPFSSLFFHRDFTMPLTEELAGIYRQPLEMVRRAPSANNRQPWRIVLDKDVLHFCQHSSMMSGGFTSIDLGIALCHFEQTCRELNIAGRFEVLNISLGKREKYCISWVAD